MPKRILQGTVTSTANAQTVTVSVERRFTHPVLKKTIRKSKKYRAHDGADQYGVGEVVRIQECAPKSKTKRWEVIASRTPEMEWVPAEGHAATAD
jgi:small subunit ribosomal protein S17